MPALNGAKLLLPLVIVIALVSLSSTEAFPFRRPFTFAAPSLSQSPFPCMSNSPFSFFEPSGFFPVMRRPLIADLSDTELPLLPHYGRIASVSDECRSAQLQALRAPLARTPFRVAKDPETAAYSVQADVPDVREEDVELTLDHHSRTLSVRILRRSSEGCDHVVRSELLEKIITLPRAAQLQRVTARLENGVLRIDIPTAVGAVASGESSRELRATVGGHERELRATVGGREISAPFSAVSSAAADVTSTVQPRGQDASPPPPAAPAALTMPPSRVRDDFQAEWKQLWEHFHHRLNPSSPLADGDWFDDWFDEWFNGFFDGRRVRSLLHAPQDPTSMLSRDQFEFTSAPPVSVPPPSAPPQPAVGAPTRAFGSSAPSAPSARSLPGVCTCESGAPPQAQSAAPTHEPAVADTTAASDRGNGFPSGGGHCEVACEGEGEVACPEWAELQSVCLHRFRESDAEAPTASDSSDSAAPPRRTAESPQSAEAAEDTGEPRWYSTPLASGRPAHVGTRPRAPADEGVVDLDADADA